MKRTVIWGEYDGAETRTHAIAYRAEPIQVEALTLEPRIISDLDGEGDLGLEIIARVGDIQLAQEISWGLGIFGDPTQGANAQELESLINDWLPQVIHLAHQNAQIYLTQAEERLKALREVNNALRFVTLLHDDKRVRLTLGMAHLILLLKDKQAQKPFHLERLAGHMAACFNCVGRPYAYIAFNPDVLEYHQGVVGRFGLYNVVGPGEAI